MNWIDIILIIPLFLKKFLLRIKSKLLFIQNNRRKKQTIFTIQLPAETPLLKKMLFIFPSAVIIIATVTVILQKQ